ncbi:MAG: porin family protein [Chromatiales bacterium]|nr:porin family protein [Chromatiales bacterium]
MKRILMAAVLGVSAVTLAHADTHKGWSIGAAAVFADFNDDENFFDDSSVGFKLSAGYRFNKYFGLEGAYVNTGDFSGAVPEELGELVSGNVELSFRGFTAHAVGFIPVPVEDLQPFIRVGYFDFSRDISDSVTTLGLGSNDGLAVGVGTFIRISDDFDIRAEFDWYDAQDADLWSINLGLQYRFGAPR